MDSTAVSKPTSFISPQDITKLAWSGRAMQALLAAIELNAFTPLAAAPATAIDAARQINCTEKGLRHIYNALSSLNLLRKSGDAYALSEAARVYLLPESELNLLEYLKHGAVLAASWGQLAECVRTGRSIENVDKEESATKFFPALAEAIFPTSYTVAREIAKTVLDQAALKAGSKEPVRVLDVASGSAAWSIPFAEASTSVRVDALDFAPVLEVAKRLSKRHGVDNQFAYLTGDWRSVDLEKEAYDVIIFGHIFHSEGHAASKALLEKCHAALKKGGKVVVAEFIADDDEDSPVGPMLFALNMYLLTTDGCVFSESGLFELLRDTGYGNPEKIFDERNSCTVVAAEKA